MGTFHRWEADPKRIIASCFSQVRSSKVASEINWEAWRRVLRKIRKQTLFVNEKYGKHWSLHFAYNTVSNDEENQARFRELVEDMFRDDPIDIWFRGVLR